MITARLLSSSGDADRHELVFRVTGHAGSADPGRDLVCSAASILFYTAAHTVSALCGPAGATSSGDVSADPGEGIISLSTTDPDLYGEAYRACLFALTGFRILSSNYPDFVTVVSDKV